MRVDVYEWINDFQEEDILNKVLSAAVWESASHVMLVN